MEKIARFLRRILISYKQNAITSDWKAYLLFDLIPPVSQTLFFSLVAHYIYGPVQLKKWMIGNAILMASFTALFGVGTQLVTEKYHGTLSLVMASKTRLHEVLLSSTISAMAFSLISVSLGLSLVSLLLGISWTLELILAFAVILLVAVFVAMSFGYVFSCLILVTSETNMILNVTSRILLIFTGANFPIERLPIGLQGISRFLPLTRTIQVAQAVIEGDVLSAHYQLLGEEVLVGIVFILLGAFLMTVMERQARKTGRMEFV
ncbi:ABC transporter permease [Streptococcus moroccensis]|uniref:Transport permease protein n=1 Tax=Streptococcus moroccensis TaxID=1451356 RepID=A0ABT9YTB0_9STRE|nr:ABC transporter permease [Streptococcus moroccensis]MDQ0223229.1 ABC-2 type transport system permease protein [Streptococcus moroccensis]